MRSFEWRPDHKFRDTRPVAISTGNNRVHCGGFECLLKIEIWQQGRQTFGKHGLTSSWWADHQQVMPASSRNRERVDCEILTNHIADIHFLRLVLENCFDLDQFFVGWRSHRNCCPVKVCDLTETAGADDIHVIDQKRLSKVLLWNDGTAKPGSLRSQQRRQDSGDGAKRAIKSEFSQMQCLGNALGVQFATGGQYRDSNSQIES